MAQAKLIVAASETDANLYYVTGFWAPDPFIYAEIDGKKLLVMSDLELDRAKAQAHVDEVLSSSKIQARLKKKNGDQAGMAGLIDDLFKQRGVSRVEVPGDFPVALADPLRRLGYTLEPVSAPFYPQRMIKRKEEVQAIRKTLEKTEAALQSAIELIRESEIRKDVLWLRGKPLTSELIRKTLHLTLMGADCLARETIVAGGRDACDPHCIGSGSLKAHWPIVLDVFPVSLETRYYADITRTVVKGKPSAQVKKMYRAVRQGQEIAFSRIREGVNGKTIHEAILAHFKKQGFPTGEKNGRMQGFFHGTGHGLGLEIHEPPRIGPVSDTLKAGMVVTVEPGLYYLEAGGVRIEDDVLVTRTGCENLTTLPKRLELD